MVGDNKEVYVRQVKSFHYSYYDDDQLIATTKSVITTEAENLRDILDQFRKFLIVCGFYGVEEVKAVYKSGKEVSSEYEL